MYLNTGASPAPPRCGQPFQVKQMRHVVAARVLQDSPTPPHTTGGGKPSVPWGGGGGGGEGGPSGEGEEDLDGLDLLAGMASNDTDYRKV